MRHERAASPSYAAGLTCPPPLASFALVVLLRGTAATTAAVVSFIILNDTEPWLLDEHANELLFELPANTTFYQWLESQGPHAQYVVLTRIHSAVHSSIH